SCHSCSNTWKTACSLMDSSRLCKFDPWLFSVLPTNCRPFPAKLACHKPNGWQSSNYVRWLAMILDNRIWKRVHHETYADTPYDAVPGHRTDGSVFPAGPDRKPMAAASRTDLRRAELPGVLRPDANPPCHPAQLPHSRQSALLLRIDTPGDTP